MKAYQTEKVVRSGLLYLPLNLNGSIIAEKSFTVQDLLPLGVPVLLWKLKANGMHTSRGGVLPIMQFGVVNQLWTVSIFIQYSVKYPFCTNPELLWDKNGILVF